MPSLFAGIHLQNKPKEILPLDDIDFERDVQYLKEAIAGKLQYDANNLEIIYNGLVLNDASKLLDSVRPNGTVHCFSKTKQNIPYEPPAEVTTAENIKRVGELFSVIAHTQINLISRVNILQKVLAEFPEFRRNMGAQALIRDSVLFNTLHQPEVVKDISVTYPIICEAAPFMVETIKKELARSAGAFSELATDSTNSSEEENSGERSTSGAQSEIANIRMISRQQLQAALARIAVGSVNSLSNIAQRRTDANAAAGGPGSSAPLSTSASGERISSAMLRTELQRAFDSLGQRSSQNASATTTSTQESGIQQMDTTESSPENPINMQDMSDNSNSDIPVYYRTHQYAEQLRTMAQMGFLNYEDNLMYLNIANGDIENAVNLLMGAMN